VKKTSIMYNMCLTSKVPVSEWGTLGFWVGLCELNFWYSFLKHLKRHEITLDFWKYNFYFNLVCINKSYATLCPKKVVQRALQKKSQKIEFFQILIFFSKIIFCLHVKLCFILFGLVMRKIWTVWFGDNLSIFLKKWLIE